MTEALLGRNAVVTGGQSGDGRAIVQRFTREGANVVVADIRGSPRGSGPSTIETVADIPGDAHFVKTDVTSVSDIETAVQAAVGEFRSLDVMVNNAGVWPGEQPVESVGLEEYQRVMEINTQGVFFGSKVAIETMRAEGTEHGSIVNMSFLSDLYRFEDSALYCTSKGGVSNLTRALALEVAPEDIRVNAINLGVIQTRMAIEDGIEDDVVENIPLGRWGQPEDVANAALFLASDESSYITGINLPVDAGLAANDYW